MFILLLLLPLIAHAGELSLKRKRVEFETNIAVHKRARFDVNVQGEISLRYDSVTPEMNVESKSEIAEVKVLDHSVSSNHTKKLIYTIDKTMIRFINKKKYLEKGYRLEGLLYSHLKKYNQEIVSNPAVREQLYWNVINHLLPVNDFQHGISSSIVINALGKLMPLRDIVTKVDNNGNTTLALSISSNNTFLNQLFTQLHKKYETRHFVTKKQNREEEV